MNTTLVYAPSSSTSPRNRRSAAFTLVELLTVIAIIVLLVGITIGILGSTLATVGVGSFWLLPDLPIAHAIPLGIFGSIAGQTGDLVESMLKRTFGVKDSGKILPGHGGLLDRIDALLFVAPVAYYYVALS